jgi:hypothetical protein
LDDNGARQDVRPVLLVDRACKGGFEFRHDNLPVVFAAGEIEHVVTLEQAAHVFSHEHLKVWTTDGQFVHRVAVKDVPGFKGLAALLASRHGGEILDDSAIEIDPKRVEGWNTDGVDRRFTQQIPVSIPASEMRERQASGAGHLSFAAR